MAKHRRPDSASPIDYRIALLAILALAATLLLLRARTR